MTPYKSSEYRRDPLTAIDAGNGWMRIYSPSRTRTILVVFGLFVPWGKWKPSGDTVVAYIYEGEWMSPADVARMRA